jgi:putative transposase
MTPEQQAEALRSRQRERRPWHGPPHFTDADGLYLLTAACYEHRPVVGFSPQRMAAFEAELLETTEAHARQIFAWIVLPNHYHLLVHAPDLEGLLGTGGQLHGRTSYRWNGEEHCRGRHVWHRAAETAMKSERHVGATLNYVLHNAVHHGYVERWQDWPYSNAAQYLAEVGREVAERRWREYPILDYGKDWDPPEL